MDPLVIGGVFFVIAAVVAALIMRGAAPYAKMYAVKRTFLTAGERAFLDALEEGLGPGYRFFAQVRLADVLTVANKYKGRDRTLAFNRIALKSIDFLVCDRSYRVLAAIELNDRSHDQPARQRRDAFLRDIFTQLGVPFIEVRARSRYDPDEVRALVLERLDIPSVEPNRAKPGSATAAADRELETAG